MRFIILSIVLLFAHSAVFAQNPGSGFEGTYKVQRVTSTTGSWKNFWARPDVSKLQEVTLEKDSNNLYVGLQDSDGMTWSANYGVCEGDPGEYCNARKSADGQTLEIEFFADWSQSHLVIRLGRQKGELVLTSQKGPATLVFDHSM